MTYTKKAVKRDELGNMFLDCECGEHVPLPYIQGMPMTYMCGNCGISYDGRGFIIERPERNEFGGWTCGQPKMT